MIETWVLLVWMASGEVVMVPRETALVCDAERSAIERVAASVCVAPGARFPVAASCHPAELLGDEK